MQASVHIRHLFIFLILAIVFPVLSASAQQPSIRISPAIIERGLAPGEIFSASLSITNQESATQIYYITKRNLKVSGESAFYTEEETEFEISSWIKIPRESITVETGQTKEISFTISVPKEASPGSHFGAIFVSLQPSISEEIKETISTVGYMVGTIISIRVPGNIIEDAQLREFSTNRSIYNKPKVVFNSVVDNMGNVVVRPFGIIQITDLFGKKITTADVNKSGLVILPKSKRKLVSSWEGEGLVFGRYQAALSLVYGEESKKSLTGNTSFWVLPLKIILPFLGAIIVMVLSIFLFVRIHIKRRLHELSQSIEERVGGVKGSLEIKDVLLKKNSPITKLTLLILVLLIFSMLLLIILFLFLA